MAHPFQTETVGAIQKALAEAQAKIQNPAKNATNSHYKSKYTTLDEVLNVAREALSSVGISIFQRTYMIENLVMVETVLGHASGEQLCSHYPMAMLPFKPQDGQLSLTYARRGALCAMVGIAGEDDDGNTANKATTIANPRAEKDTKASSELLEFMMSGLQSCQTEDELTVWTLSNKGNKANLTLSDQAIITRTYKQVMESIKEKNNG